MNSRQNRKGVRDAQKAARRTHLQSMTRELLKLDALIARARKYVRSADLQTLDFAEVEKMRERVCLRWNSFREKLLQPLNEEKDRRERERTKGLKVYGGGLIVSKFEDSVSVQVRAIVAARSKAEVARVAGVSAYQLKNYWCETANERELQKSLAVPGVLLIAALHGFDSDNFVRFDATKHGKLR